MDPEMLRGVGRVPHGGTDDPDLLDFSANTNPAVPEGVEEVYAAALEASRSYPPEPPTTYREAAAAFVDVEPSSVLPTPGGLAAIRLALESTITSGDSVLVPFPSFGEYSREVRLQGATPSFVPYSSILEADPVGHAVAIICNPNNPTGEAYEHEELLTFASRCREADTVLLIDEAFLGFTEQPSLAGVENVVVARSLTKLFGLPGLRAGHAVGTGELLETMKAARLTWNLGTPALTVGRFCLRQDDFVEETRKQVRSERSRVREALSTSFEVGPSDAPFLLLDIGDREVSDVLASTRARGVAVRDATTFRGLESHVRVAIRLPEENDRLVEVLEHV